MPVFCLVSFELTTVIYSLEYWNERAAEWRGTGCSSHSRSLVRQHQLKMIRQSGMSGSGIRFRVLEIPVA